MIQTGRRLHGIQVPITEAGRCQHECEQASAQHASGRDEAKARRAVPAQAPRHLAKTSGETDCRTIRWSRNRTQPERWTFGRSDDQGISHKRRDGRSDDWTTKESHTSGAMEVGRSDQGILRCLAHRLQHRVNRLILASAQFAERHGGCDARARRRHQRSGRNDGAYAAWRRPRPLQTARSP
jgi:hypothetical protein